MDHDDVLAPVPVHVPDVHGTRPLRGRLEHGWIKCSRPVLRHDHQRTRRADVSVEDDVVSAVARHIANAGRVREGVVQQVRRRSAEAASATRVDLEGSRGIEHRHDIGAAVARHVRVVGEGAVLEHRATANEPPRFLATTIRPVSNTAG